MLLAPTLGASATSLIPSWTFCGGLRDHSSSIGKTKSGQIKPIDECVDNTHRIVFIDPVLKALWKHSHLRSIYTSL